MGIVTEVYSPGSFGPCSLGRNRGATGRLGELHSHLPMRAHALVLLLIAAVVAPAGRVDGEQSVADAVWDPGYQLARRGDYIGAQQFFASMVDQGQSSIAPHALLLLARAALADADTDTAEAALQQLLRDYPSSDQVAGAYFSLEQVRRAVGDCAGAMRALDAFEESAGATAIGPYAAIQRAQCAVKLGDWSGELRAARAALAIDGGGPRLTRIEALERAAEAEVKTGHKQEAFDFYNQALELAGTRAYNAEMLFTTATLAHALGQDALAADRFRAVVVDYADQARAPGALDALADLDRAGTVSPLQAGLARLNGREYRTAVSLFDQVEPGSPDWGAAQLSRVEALLKLSNDDQARQGLLTIADSDAAHAGSALLRLGQLQERDGALADAQATHMRIADLAPDRAAEALFHVGFMRFVRGDRAGALSAWQTGLASGPPAPSMQAQLRYWTARVLPAGTGPAQDALSKAATIAPESYHGLRAQEQLDSALVAASTTASNSTAWLAPSATEIQERAAWSASFKTTPERAAGDVAGLAALKRADALLELGLRTEASWEVDGVVQQYAQAKDLAHIAAVGDCLAARDPPPLTLPVGPH